MLKFFLDHSYKLCYYTFIQQDAKYNVFQVPVEIQILQIL